MRSGNAVLLSALIVLGTQPGFAAEVVHPDVTGYLTRVEPTHRLVETSRLEIPYGDAAGTIGFEPGGNEREAVGPASFGIDPKGDYFVADPVHREIKRVEIRSGVPIVSPAGKIELPSSAIEGGARVVKCNPEAGLVTLPGGKKIRVEIGGPLASIRLVGVNSAGDVFLIIERFVERGKLAVERQVIVLDAAGAFKARLDVTGRPAVRPVREFAIGPEGALHRMVTGDTRVTLVKWEVRR